MPVSIADIDIAIRGELENMMVLEKLPFSCLTCVLGYQAKYSLILKLLLRTLNCIKVVGEKKGSPIKVKAFIEMPKNYQDSVLYRKWISYKERNVSYSSKFQVAELRYFYPQMAKCGNFCIENIIDRGESRDYFKEWKGVIAKCAFQYPDVVNPFRITEAKDALAISVRPLQILRGAKLIKVEELSNYKDMKVNGRMEMSSYMYIGSLEDLILFIKGTFS